MKDLPRSIGGDFRCQVNQIISFEGAPEYVGGNFYCNKNPIWEIWRLFEDYSKVELFNDYDIIRGDTVILDRLNSFLMDIKKPTVTEVPGYKCI